MSKLSGKAVLMYLFVLSCIVSCSDDEPDFPESNDPEFYTSFIVSGEEVRYTAGEEPYYMKSGTDRDEHGVYRFVGELSDFDCTIDNCPGSVRFIFRDDTVLTENSSNIDQSLRTGVVPFYTPYDSSLIGVDVTFNSNTSKGQQFYGLSWDFGNGKTDSKLNPTTFYHPGASAVHVMCKTLDHDSGTVTTNTLTADFTEDCSVDFTYQFATGQIAALNTQTQGSGNFSFEWDFGYGFMPLSDQPPLDFSGIDTIFVCLRATSDEGCVSTRCKTLLVNPNYDIAVTDFEYETELDYDVFEEHFSEFTMVYVDEGGKVYHSAKYEQPAFAGVEILEVSDYAENERGSPTKKVLASFDVRVFGNSESDFLDIKKGQASIAVAYP